MTTSTTPPASYGQTSSTLWGPYTISVSAIQQLHDKSTNSTSMDISNNNNTKTIHNDFIEVSVHTLPKPLRREFQHVFQPESTIPKYNDCNDDEWEVFAIPTNQRALHDLVKVGEEIEDEKDRLLNTFLNFSQMLHRIMQSPTHTNEQQQVQQYWCDYIDPCSGLPMVTTSQSNKVYSEVDGMTCCLQYKCYNAGYCKILIHPEYGSSVYPATIFTYAPRSYIISLFQSILSIHHHNTQRKQQQTS